MNPPAILISSSSDDDLEVEDEESESESEFSSESDSDGESDDEEYDTDDEDGVRSGSDDLEYDSVEEDDVTGESEDVDCSDNREELCDKVIRLLHQGRRDLQELNLDECKAYLRKHQLRLSGTKEECIQRIKEHWRIKDGKGEELYPKSSFTINCTGDACKGDVVLFTQKVYKKFDKVRRSGSVLGRRSVAGRIVKESYGAAKQQHTFTIEVLWSKGFQKLPPLSSLLVKGRNLYRFKTLRQRWRSETERSKVLAEKHNRGAAARHKRATKKTKMSSYKDEGKKRQILSGKGPPRMKKPIRKNKQKCAKKPDAASLTNANTTAQKRKAAQIKNTESKRAKSNSHPSTYIHRSSRAYHPEEASFSLPYDRPSSSSLIHCRPPHGFPSYSHYSYEQPGVSRPLYGQFGYAHQSYEQPVPRNRATNTYGPPPFFH